MKKFLLVFLCSLMLFLCACGQIPPVSESPALTGDEVSIDPADYGISEDMLKCNPLPDFEEMSIQALGAYLLNSDGAGSEGAGDTLYMRFLAEPEDVINYFASIGEQAERGGETAAAVLCRALAYTDIAWVDGNKIPGVVEDFREGHADDDAGIILDWLEQYYEEAAAGR